MGRHYYVSQIDAEQALVSQGFRYTDDKSLRMPWARNASRMHGSCVLAEVRYNSEGFFIANAYR